MRGALVLVLAACGGAAPVPDPIATPRAATDPIPGLLWITPAQRWRVTEPANTVLLAPGGATVLAGADRGRLDRYDVRTGAPLPRIQLPTGLPVAAIAPVGTPLAGRFVVVAQSSAFEHRRGRAVFEVTIARAGAGDLVGAPREIPMPAMPPPRGATDEGFVDAAAFSLADGSVVITGNGLPLAAYDPATWKAKTVFARDRGWSRLRRGGHYLVAAHASVEQRFDLTTGAATPVRGVLNQVAADGSIVLTRFAGHGDGEANVGRRIVSILHRESDTEAPLGTFDEISADPDHPRVVARDRDTLEVHDLDGTLTATLALPEHGPGIGLEDASWAGDRFAATAGSMIVVVDLAAGTISPPGAPPYASSPIAIADDGTVTGRDARVAWDARDGKRLHAVAVDGDADPLPQVPGALLVRRDKQVSVVAPADAQPVRATWALGWRPLSAFVARDGGALVVESDMKVDRPFDLLRIARGGGPQVALFQHNWDSNMADLDVDSGDALVALGGRVGVVRANVPQPFALRAPDCVDSGGARLEIGGARAATWTKDAIAVWDRTTGTLRAAARLETAIEDVQFVPHRAELAIATRDGLVLWLPDGAAGEARVLAAPAIDWLAVSPSGKRLGVSFADGRIAALDLDAVLARTPASPDRLARPQIPAQCGSAGVFDSPPPPPETPPEVEPPDDGGCEDCGD